LNSLVSLPPPRVYLPPSPAATCHIHRRRAPAREKLVPNVHAFEFNLRRYNTSNSFLLDDDSSIHFTIDDISGTMSQIDLNAVQVPEVGLCTS
jgi:hypothetical protein